MRALYPIQFKAAFVQLLHHCGSCSSCHQATQASLPSVSQSGLIWPNEILYSTAIFNVIGRLVDVHIECARVLAQTHSKGTAGLPLLAMLRPLLQHPSQSYTLLLATSSSTAAVSAHIRLQMQRYSNCYVLILCFVLSFVLAGTHGSLPHISCRQQRA